MLWKGVIAVTFELKTCIIPKHKLSGLTKIELIEMECCNNAVDLVYHLKSSYGNFTISKPKTRTYNIQYKILN